MWRWCALVVALRAIVSADPYVPVYEPIDPWSVHHGLTANYELGVGILANDGGRATFGQGGGVGVWLTPRLALTARLGLAVYSRGNGFRAVWTSFAGAEAQLWLASAVWVAFGYGRVDQVTDIYDAGEMDHPGTGFDTRIGYSLSTHAAAERPAPTTSVNFSIDLTTGFFDSNLQDHRTVTLAILVGYQYL